MQPDAGRRAQALGGGGEHVVGGQRAGVAAAVGEAADDVELVGGPGVEERPAVDRSRVEVALAQRKALVEAARSVGMSGFLLFRRVVFPVAVRQA